jgi:hypothetical protein
MHYLAEIFKERHFTAWLKELRLMKGMSSQRFAMVWALAALKISINGYIAWCAVSHIAAKF